MKWFVSSCLVFMGIIFLCLLYRLLVHYQLSKVDVTKTTVLFQTKLNHFKQKELRKSFAYLFIGTMGLVTVLSFAIIQLLKLEMQVQTIRSNNQVLQGEIKTIQKKEGSKESSKNLLKGYPSSGLNLGKKLDAENQTINKKEQLENNLADELQPYIDNANVTLSSGSEADSLNLMLTGLIEANNTNLVLLGQNIAALMQELEGIEKINEVHVSIVDREGNDLYKGTYIRNEKGLFTFQSELRKGKG